MMVKILVVAETYREYRAWGRRHFPYLMLSVDPALVWVRPGEEGADQMMSLESNTPYFHLSGVVHPDIARRFTRIRLV